MCERCLDSGRVLTSTKGKPFNEVIPDWSTITGMKSELTASHFKREGLGIWARETRGWYSEDNLDKCVRQGLANGLEPEIARMNRGTQRGVWQPDDSEPSDNIYYFMGIDPAPSQSVTADDGAMAVLRARPRPGLGAAPTSNESDWLAEYVWAYRVRGETKRQLDDGVFIATRSREWSGLIHAKHHHFGLGGILMDKQGGGAHVVTEMNKGRQLIDGVEQECTPIACADDVTVSNAAYLLNLFRRRDVGVETLWPILQGDDNLAEAMHIIFQEAVEHAVVSFPLPFNDRPGEVTKEWDREKRWALINLDEARRQMMNIQAVTNDDGSWAMTKNNAKQFVANGKKDLAYACIFAYVRFRIWLKMGELEFSQQGEDEEGCYRV